MLQKYGRRFLYYGFGLALGILITKYIVKGKGGEFTYLPEARVLKDFKKKQLEYNDYIDCYFEASAFSKAKFQSLWDHSELDIDFSESEPRKEPYGMYQLYAEYKEKSYSFMIENRDSTVVMSQFKPKAAEVKCP